MGGPEVEAFLSHLATEGRVASSTQNQALAALLFLYREVLQNTHLERVKVLHERDLSEGFGEQRVAEYRAG